MPEIDRYQNLPPDRTRRGFVIAATITGGALIGTLSAEAINYQNEINSANHIEEILQRYHFSQWADVSHPFIPSWGKDLEKPANPEEDTLLSSRTLPAVESNSRDQRTLGGGLCDIMTPATKGTVYFPSDPHNWDIYVRSIDRPIQVSIEQRGEDSMFVMEDAYDLAQRRKLDPKKVPHRFDEGNNEVGALSDGTYLRAYIFLVQKPVFWTNNETSQEENISRRAALTTIFEALK